MIGKIVSVHVEAAVTVNLLATATVTFLDAAPAPVLAPGIITVAGTTVKATVITAEMAVITAVIVSVLIAMIAVIVSVLIAVIVTVLIAMIAVIVSVLIAITVARLPLVAIKLLEYLESVTTITQLHNYNNLKMHFLSIVIVIINKQTAYIPFFVHAPPPVHVTCSQSQHWSAYMASPPVMTPC